MVSNYSKYTLRTPSDISREEERVKLQEHTKLVNEQRDKLAKRRANYNTFLAESKNFLIVEAMNKMLLQCLPDLDEHLSSVARNCCENFVREEGANNILKRCTSTLFLNEFAIILEDTHKKVILGAADSKEDEFQIDNSVMKDYYDKLRSMNYGPMCNTIINRVADAEKDFVTANIRDREKMEEAAEKAAEKIDKVRSKDEDIEEKIKQEYTLMYKRELDDINKRRRNILESMIKRFSESVLVSESYKEGFITESGKLDRDKVINTAEVMYTFLEMVNTTQIKKVDTVYIESVLKGIQ